VVEIVVSFLLKGEFIVFFPNEYSFSLVDEMALIRFYEWLEKGKTKVPHFTKMGGEREPMVMAGLWDSVTFVALPVLSPGFAEWATDN
jgi:hypothetical protein